MNKNLIRTLSLTLGVLALSAGASAQTVVSDNDNEVRNAYQLGCETDRPVPGFHNTTCTLPPLPPGKRLAIRYVSAKCFDRPGGVTRNQQIKVQRLRLAQNSQEQSAIFVPRRVATSSAAGPVYALAEPVYMHTDNGPVLFISWEGEGEFACDNISIFGFLVNR